MQRRGEGNRLQELNWSSQPFRTATVRERATERI
jgi:hypothetical protein